MGHSALRIPTLEIHRHLVCQNSFAFILFYFISYKNTPASILLFLAFTPLLCRRKPAAVLWTALWPLAIVYKELKADWEPDYCQHLREWGWSCILPQSSFQQRPQHRLACGLQPCERPWATVPAHKDCETINPCRFRRFWIDISPKRVKKKWPISRWKGA